MFRLSLMAAIFFCCSIAYSQSASKHAWISGVVQDPAGAAIAGARVELIMAQAVQQSAATDQSGGFQFKAVAAGNYQVRITSAGFETTNVDVAVNCGPIAPLQITLPIASLQQETTVTALPDQISTEAANNKDSVVMSEQSLSNLPIF